MAADAASASGPSAAWRPARLALLGRRGWTTDEVAAILDGRRAEFARLARSGSPWKGIPEDELESLLNEAIARACQLAVGKKASDWRTEERLMSGAIAVYRFAARSWWKEQHRAVRSANLHTVSYDPDIDARSDDQFQALWSDDDRYLRLVDWAHDLPDDLAQVWRPFLMDGSSLASAGSAAGLTRAQVERLRREGERHRERFLRRASAGGVCRSRHADIEAHMAGKADDVQERRALAHMAWCTPCAWGVGSTAYAHAHGFLGLMPVAVLARLAVRMRDQLAFHATDATVAAATASTSDPTTARVTGGLLGLGTGKLVAALVALAATAGTAVEVSEHSGAHHRASSARTVIAAKVSRPLEWPAAAAPGAAALTPQTPPTSAPAAAATTTAASVSARRRRRSTSSSARRAVAAQPERPATAAEVERAVVAAFPPSAETASAGSSGAAPTSHGSSSAASAGDVESAFGLGGSP